MSSYFRGVSGKFTVMKADGPAAACYILTSMRAEPDGSWPAMLTDKMRPWREVFDVQKMTLDELVQRDLDDSRVANDLIPYLLGRTTSKFPVFPPILAVLVEVKPFGTGIQPTYPASADGKKFGDLFSISEVSEDLVQCNYNSHKAGFVVVDGQHRAMAVLALFRQAQGSRAWDGPGAPYRGYYEHIKPTQEQLATIELPVCVIYFPQLHAGASNDGSELSDLTRVCRQIFLDVNKEAKKVSKTRELLLEDSDFAAILMRRALGRLRDQEDGDGTAKLYAFDYGKGETSDYERIGSLSPTEYSSVQALYVVAGALSFGRPDAMKLSVSLDVTDGRNRRNPERPARLLRGLADAPARLTVHHASTIASHQRAAIVDALAELWSPIIPGMFGSLRPYVIHNRSLIALKAEFETPEAGASPALVKVRSLLFDGSGGRAVFELHVNRMEEYLKEISEFGSLDEYRPREVIERNLTFCRSVETAMFGHVHRFKQMRAAEWWGVSLGKLEDEKHKDLVQRADRVFTLFSTQAFQIGYAMAIASLHDYIISTADPQPEFNIHVRIVEWLTRLTNVCLEAFLTANPEKRKALHADPRGDAFDGTRPSLRMFINSARGDTLDAKAWPYFRWAVLEIVFSPYCRKVLAEYLKTSDPDVGSELRAKLPAICSDLADYRDEAVTAAKDRALKAESFKQRTVEAQAKAKVESKDDKGIEDMLAELADEEKARVGKLMQECLEASLGKNPVLSKVPGSLQTLLDAADD